MPKCICGKQPNCNLQHTEEFRCLQKIELLHYHDIVARIPEETKKEISDWMDEQDRIHEKEKI